MPYLVRFHPRKQHTVAHYTHMVSGITGALCSHQAKPSVGDWSKQGEWRVADALPPDVRLCRRCQLIKQKIDDPLPRQVKRELEMLSRWDERAAAIQREKMLAHYREKQKRRRSGKGKGIP